MYGPVFVRKNILSAENFIFMDLFAVKVVTESDIKVSMGGKGRDYASIWHIFRSTRIPFVIVQLQGILRKRYTCRLPTLFLTKSVPTLMSLCNFANLTVKKAMKMKFSYDKKYHTFLLRRI